MAIETRKTIFFHFPKCGGTFVKSILKQICDQYKAITPSHVPPSMAGIQSDKFKFTFLRDPISWYASYYSARKAAFRESLKSTYAIGFDKTLYRTFSEFIKEATEKHKGFLSKLYEDYYSGCQYVGIMENLKVSLIKALQLAGEACDVKKILGSPKENVKEEDVAIAKKDIKLITDSEHRALEIYQIIINKELKNDTQK